MTEAYLVTLPGRDVFRERLTALYASDLVSAPHKRGDQYPATNLVLVDLTQTVWEPRAIIDDFDNQWSVIGNVGTLFYILTSVYATRQKVVTVDLADPDAVFVDLVPEGDDLINWRLQASAVKRSKTIKKYWVAYPWRARLCLSRHKEKGRNSEGPLKRWPMNSRRDCGPR